MRNNCCELESQSVHLVISVGTSELQINFSTGEISPKREYSVRLQKSVAYYRESLADHLRRHNVDPSALKNITLHHRRTRLGVKTVMLATDDRNVDHRVIVRRG